MNNFDLMEFDEAQQVVKELGGKYGYTDFKTFATTYSNNLEKIVRIGSDIKEWDGYYLTALLSLGPHYGLKEEANLNPDGTGTRSAWYSIAFAIRKELNYRNSTGGKKEILRKMTPATVRDEEDDVMEKICNEKILIEMKNGQVGKSKRQMRLNEERLQHIYALEETLAKGGSLRTLCEEALEGHNSNIKNLPTNEEAATMAAKDKRKNKVFSLILSWFVMPVYVLMRALDILCDSVIVAKVKHETLESRFSLHAPFLGRLTIPFLLSGFMAYTEIVDIIKGNKLPMNGDMSFHYIMSFLGCLLVITIVKSLVGFPVAYAADYFGKVVEWSSDRFESADANYFQFGLVESSAATLEQYKEIFEARQKLIRDLRDAIANCTPKCELDDLRRRGDFSLTTLEKEKEAFLKEKGKERGV